MTHYRSELTGATRTLGQSMSDISEEVYCAGWLHGTEWILWRALLDWRATGRGYWSPGARYPSDITEHMPRLDELHRAAGGWVWWLNDGTSVGERFVPTRQWLRLVGLRDTHPHLENEELARLLTEESTDDT